MIVLAAPAVLTIEFRSKEYGRIIRDSTGKVVSVELPDASYHSDEEVHVKEFSLDNNISNFGGDQDPWVPDVPAESSKVVRGKQLSHCASRLVRERPKLGQSHRCRS